MIIVSGLVKNLKHCVVPEGKVQELCPDPRIFNVCSRALVACRTKDEIHKKLEEWNKFCEENKCKWLVEKTEMIPFDIKSIVYAGKIPNTKISQYTITIRQNNRIRLIMMTKKDLAKTTIPETYQLNPDASFPTKTDEYF